MNKSKTGNPIFSAFLIDFNQHVRFNYIVRELAVLIKSLRAEKTTLSILDVGSGLGTLSEYLAREFSSVVVNVEISPVRKLGNLVVADGSSLPFKDASFDFLVSSDVLEHAKSDDRLRFVGELMRCCRLGLVITYSKLHKNHSSQSGIKIFENFCRNCLPGWYLEHNRTKIVDDVALLNSLKESAYQIIEQKPLSGVLTLFFTGIQCRLTIQPPRFILNLIAYLATRLIDPPPYYGFGLTASKHKL